MSLMEVVKAAENIVEPVVAKIEVEIALIADEASAKVAVEGLILAELDKIAPLSVIETRINGYLPLIIKPFTPIVGMVENAVIPKLEVDVIKLVTELVFGFIGKKLGDTWFSDMKAKITCPLL